MFFVHNLENFPDICILFLKTSSFCSEACSLLIKTYNLFHKLSRLSPQGSSLFHKDSSLFHKEFSSFPNAFSTFAEFCWRYLFLLVFTSSIRIFLLNILLFVPKHIVSSSKSLAFFQIVLVFAWKALIFVPNLQVFLAKLWTVA